jgi:predicted Zn-dependent peptidase
MKYSIKTLKNGLRILTVPMKDNPTVTVLVLVGTGSDYEDKSLNGISHFLEHMCFKGTIKRPNSNTISHELDSLGSEYNAFTDHEMTGYYAKGDSKNFKKLLDIVGDIYLNSTFPENEIEKEKGVICEEINMYEDMPARHVHDVFDDLVYGDIPAGRNIAGTHATVRSMKREDFVKYHLSQYTASNTVVVVTGNIDSSLVYKEIDKIFSKLSTSKSKSKAKSTFDNTTKIKIENKKTDQVHLMLGLKSYKRNDPRNKTLRILSAVLGAGMSSRLFNKLREEMGVCYYVSSHLSLRADTGMFAINAGVTTVRTNEVIGILLEELNRLTKELVGGPELKKVKNLLIGNMKLGLESSDDIANFYGTQLLLKNEIKSLKEKEKEILSVTAKDIQKIAKDIIKSENLRLAIVGPETVKIDPKTLVFK